MLKNLTVKELRELLKDAPDDYVIGWFDDYFDVFVAIQEIAIEKGKDYERVVVQ